MKKTIPSIVLLLTIGLTNARATGGVKNEAASSKKSSPVVHVNILSDQLPTRLRTGIRKNYSSYWISDLYKKTINGRASYCITLENADKKVTLNATPPTSWAVTRVVAKDIVTP